jgi:putative hydrolase of the HAD superfamily
VTPIRGVICDFGGVLTSPLLEAFGAFSRAHGIDLAQVGMAMARVAERDGEHPLFELEKGHLTQDEFVAKLESALAEETGRAVALDGFGETYFGDLRPNQPMIDYMRSLRARGLRMALLTNNVREWAQRWRALAPVDEIFEVVVDSAFVGMRKPDRAIYDLTLERLGLPADDCVFVDDTDVNCDTARELGMAAVQFHSTKQAIADVEAALARTDGAPPAQLSEPSRSQQ